MNITLNGQSKELMASVNLKEVIDRFSQKSKYVVAEVNGNIIKRPDWSTKTIVDGDRIELVNIVGGG